MQCPNANVRKPHPSLAACAAANHIRTMPVHVARRKHLVYAGVTLIVSQATPLKLKIIGALLARLSH